MQGASGSNPHLSEAARQTLNSVANASNLGELSVVKKGIMSKGASVTLIGQSASPQTLKTAQKVSVKIADAFKELEGLVESKSISKLGDTDRALIQHVFHKLSNTDLNLGSIILSVHKNLPELTDSTTFMRTVGQLSAFAPKAENLLKEIQNQEQLGKPQANKLAQTAHQWRAALLASELPNASFQTRISLRPQPSGPGTATGSYRLKAPVDGLPQHNLFSNSSFPTSNLAIAKPANQGLGAKDNATSAGKTSDINNWGLHPGQEVQGEHLACFMQHQLHLPTNIPDTVALNLSHEAFGAQNQNLTRLEADFGIRINAVDCLKVLLHSQELGTVEPGSFITGFKEMLFDHLTNNVIGDLEFNSYHFNSEILRPQIHELLSKQPSPTPAEFYAGLSAILTSGDPPMDANATVNSLKGALAFTVERLLTSVPGAIESIAEGLFADYATVKPSDTSSFCSVQSWVNDAIDMPNMSDEQLKQVPPIAYGRIQLLDSMTVGRDRNAGNIMFQQRTKENLQQSIDSQLPGLTLFVEMNVHGQHPIPKNARDLGPDFEAKWVNATGDAVMQLYEKENGPIDPSKVAVEADVHLLLTAMFRGSDMVIDAVPIDNGLVFPDPELRSPEGTTMLSQECNNAWLTEPQARLGKLPILTKRHIMSLDLKKDVLPALIKETQNLSRTAGPDSGATVGFNESQQKYWLISARIQQIGASLDKTQFEMGLMKDKVRLETSESSLALPAPPLNTIYNKYKNISIKDLKFKDLDKEIKAGFDLLTETYGSAESGFHKITAPLINISLEQARFK